MVCTTSLRPVPLPRFQRLPEEKRRHLLDVGARAFAARGFAAASLNEILAEAGLGKSSYYYYFEDKADLYVACLLDALERLVREVPPLDIEGLTARRFWRSLEEYFEKLLVVSAGQPVQMALVRELPSIQGLLAPRFEELKKRFEAPALAIIGKGQSLGCVRTDLPADRLFAVGIAADQAMDAVFLAHGTEISAATLRAHGGLVVDTWRRLLEPGRPLAGTAPVIKRSRVARRRG
jgi:AcrR family transcriptional regulator